MRYAVSVLVTRMYRPHVYTPPNHGVKRRKRRWAPGLGLSLRTDTHTYCSDFRIEGGPSVAGLGLGKGVGGGLLTHTHTHTQTVDYNTHEKMWVSKITRGFVNKEK